MTKNLKQSLNQVVQTIGTDVKNILSRLDTIDDKLNRNAPDFNPKYWRKKATNKMVEVADGLYIDAFEFERVKFNYQFANLTKYINTSYRHFNLYLPSLVVNQAGFEPEASLWQITGLPSNIVKSGNGLNGEGQSAQIKLTHPDVVGEMNLTLKEVNQDGAGVQEMLNSIKNGNLATADLSLITGDNIYADQVVLTFTDQNEFYRYRNMMTDQNDGRNAMKVYSNNLTCELVGTVLDATLFADVAVSGVRIKQGYYTFEKHF